MRRIMTIILIFAPAVAFAEEAKRQNSYWLSLNPGLSLRQETMYVKGHGFEGGMTHPDRIDWAVDLETSNLIFHQTQDFAFGVYLLIHSGQIDFTHQEYKVPFAGAASSPDSGESLIQASFVEDSGIAVVEYKNVGTRIRGYYSYFVPAFFIEKTSWAARFGFGIGSGSVWMNGTIDLQDDRTLAILTSRRQDAPVTDALRYLGLYHLSTGLINPTSDPVRTHLLYNLGEPEMLANYGLYALSRGWTRGVSQQDLVSLYILKQYYGNSFSDMEMLGLLTLRRSNLDIRRGGIQTVMLFLEVSLLEAAKLRLALGGPFFYYRGYRYDIATLDLAIFVPIHF